MTLAVHMLRWACISRIRWYNWATKACTQSDRLLIFIKDLAIHEIKSLFVFGLAIYIQLFIATHYESAIFPFRFNDIVQATLDLILAGDLALIEDISQEVLLWLVSCLADSGALHDLSCHCVNVSDPSGHLMVANWIIALMRFIQFLRLADRCASWVFTDLIGTHSGLRSYSLLFFVEEDTCFLPDCLLEVELVDDAGDLLSLLGVERRNFCFVVIVGSALLILEVFNSALHRWQLFITANIHLILSLKRLLLHHVLHAKPSQV